MKDSRTQAESARPAPSEPAGTARASGRFERFASPEGRVFQIGAVLGVIYLVWLGASYFIDRENFHVYIGMTVAHLFFGRAAGMIFGYALDFGHAVVVPVNLAIETVMIMLLYPLFVFSVRKLLVINALKSFMDRLQETAAANQDRIRRYGTPGLFVFVFIPFWMTGPIIGSIIGYLLGLRTWVIMSVVIGGTYVATGVWAFILVELRDRMSTFTPYAPLLLIGVVILIVVAGRVLERSARNGRVAEERDKRGSDRG